MYNFLPDQPWLDKREWHRRWWTAVADRLNFYRLAPNGLARALEWVSTTFPGVELRSWDDLMSWYDAIIQVPLFDPPPVALLIGTESPIVVERHEATQLKQTGPPPKNEEPRRRFHTLAGLVEFRSSGNSSPDENNQLRKIFQARISGTVFCAPGVPDAITPDDFADLSFGRKINRLAKFGARPLAEFWLHVARERTLRGYLENLLDEFLDRLDRLGPEAIDVTGADRLVVPLHAVPKPETDDEEGEN
jgi:hypothetical protein